MHLVLHFASRLLIRKLKTPQYHLRTISATLGAAILLSAQRLRDTWYSTRMLQVFASGHLWHLPTSADRPDRRREAG